MHGAVALPVAIGQAACNHPGRRRSDSSLRGDIDRSMVSIVWTRIGVSALVCCTLASCGGSGSDSGESTSPGNRPMAASSAAITFDAPARSVLPSGAVSFSVTGVAHSAECTLDGAPATPCLAEGSRRGAIDYEALASGLHRLRVAVRAQDGEVLRSAEHVLEIVEPDVVVYAATPGGIAAAIAAAESAKTVALLEPTAWVGGMMSGGLAKTDIGPRGHEILGGWAAKFFARVHAAEIAKGACGSGCSQYDFEPHEAERTFETLLAEARVIVERSAQLTSVTKEGATLRDVQTTRGSVSGKVFIDASYEGDLMAAAGVSYIVGREPRPTGDVPTDPAALALYEDDAGTLGYRLPRGGGADPYRTPGDPASGLLRYLEPRPSPIPARGSGDDRVMAYTYRLCVTDDPGNRIPFEAPAGYDPADYEMSARLTQAWIASQNIDPAVRMFNPEPTVLSTSRAHYKYDLNGGSTFSIDMTAPDMNQAYVEASEAERERIRDAYRHYIQGLLYFWQTDPRFGGLNQKMSRFGYCRDEFADRGGWPHQLYVRQARRMIGEYVMNQNDVMQNGRRPPITDVIGFGAYNIDVHTVRYMAAPANWPDGTRRDAIVLEGFLIRHAPNDEPYPVAYRSLVPIAAEADNLLNPVTLSATHIAYASLRMEPTFMILGEAAGIAAALAIEAGTPVQQVDYGALRQRLLARGQRLSR